MNNITVSIFMLTYNQEQFIAQTIESILMQKTNFTYQLVIGEDCSTDTTRIICEKYVTHYPQKIKLLLSLEKNIGLIANYMRTIAACDGKYIAICDGDDYWIDELKLQKQVDYLESHPDFSIVFTKIKRLFSNGEFKEMIMENQKSCTTFEDLIFNNFIPSVTVLFKNNQKNEKIPSWLIHFPYGDWPTYLWTIKDEGKIYFLDEVTAIYRIDIGVSSRIRKVNSDVVKVNLNILKCIANDNGFEHKRAAINESIFRAKKNVMASLNREKKYLASLKMLFHIMLNYKQKNQVAKLYLYSIYRTFEKRN
ncbi:glycosyltransferase [Flavobacterium sp. DSP2-3-1]|uniref:glycosyltransferase n=1 Tax=Flavobacterium sp. DSP2-3-1 TaxID=2804620 RepID=UPI003CF75894